MRRGAQQVRHHLPQTPRIARFHLGLRLVELGSLAVGQTAASISVELGYQRDLAGAAAG
jgi:hypothetical protein